MTRQQKLLDSIKKGNKDNIPTIVEMPTVETPKPATITPTNSEGSDSEYAPLNIYDSSFELNPVFQDYCLQLYRLEEDEDGVDTMFQGGECSRGSSNGWDDRDEDNQHSDSSAGSNGQVEEPEGKYVSEDDTSSRNESDESRAPEDISQKEDKIVTMISEPLMEWDLETDEIFEV